MAEFLNILTAIMSVDNNCRNAAEARLNQLTEENAGAAALSLLEIMGTANSDTSVRSLAGILLRRVLDKSSDKIAADMNAFIRRKLLELWGAESNIVLLKRLNHVLAQSASNGDWKDLLPLLIQQHAAALAAAGTADLSGKSASLLSLVEVISEYSPDDIQDNLAAVGGFLSGCLNAGAGEGRNAPKVEVACARATCACVVVMRDDNARNSFKPALSPVLRVLSDALNRGDEADATSIIEYLVEIASLQPLFFRTVMDSTLQAMVTIAGSTPLDMSTRSIALEFVLSMAEAAPALCRRNSVLLNGVIPLLFSLLFEAGEEVNEKEWVRGRYAEGDNAGAAGAGGDGDDDCAGVDGVVAEDAIERLSAALGAKSVGGSLTMAITQLLASPSPVHRRAAVVAANRFAEGCATTLAKNADTVRQLTSVLVTGLTDTPAPAAGASGPSAPSPRVQYQALQGVGRFAALFPDATADLLTRFLPPITALLAAPDLPVGGGNAPAGAVCQRVKGHAANALINLINPTTIDAEDEEDEKEGSKSTSSPLAVLKQQLDPLVAALIRCLQASSLEIQSPCLVVLGCIAQVVQEGFRPYYAAIMPGVKSILRNAAAVTKAAAATASAARAATGAGADRHANVHSSAAASVTDSAAYLTLCGKAMECAGLVGEAVGNAVFAPDALEIIQLLLGAMGQQPGADGTAAAMAQSSSNDTITFDYILPACARIAKALGRHFEPFVPFVMTPLLVGANADIQFSMEDVDDDGEGGEDGTVTHDEDTNMDSTVIHVGAGVRKRVTLNTHAVQQKQQAARLIFEFAGALKGYLRGHLQACLSAVLVMVTDKHSSETRAAASAAVKPLFEAYLHGHSQLSPPQFSAAEVQSVFTACIDRLQVAVAGDVHAESRAYAVEGLRGVLQAAYDGGAQEDLSGNKSAFLVDVNAPAQGAPTNRVESIIRTLLVVCQEAFERRGEQEKALATSIASSSGGETLDASEGDYAIVLEALEEEEELITNATDALGQLLKVTGRAAYMPYFDSVIGPAFMPFLSGAGVAPSAAQQLRTAAGSNATALQFIATCLVDDVLEFGAGGGGWGELLTPQISQILSTFVAALGSPSPLLRQASSYGVAQVLLHAAPGSAPHSAVCQRLFTDILPPLLALVQHPAAKEEENVGITENAVFAIGIVLARYEKVIDAVCQQQPAAVSTVATLNSAWLSNLPMTADEKEHKCAVLLLVEMLERQDARLLGAQGANMEAISQAVKRIVSTAGKAAEAAVALRESGGCGSSDDAPFAPHPTVLVRLNSVWVKYCK